MSFNTQPKALDRAIDQAIAACGGDMREAVKALIIANGLLLAKFEKQKADVWSIFARGYRHGRWNTYSRHNTSTLSPLR
jgi:hypothetical protein